MLFRSEREAFLAERGKHYQILAAVPGRMALSDAEREFGPLILKERNEAFRVYVAGLIDALERGRAAAVDPVKRRLLRVRIDFLRELIP